MSSEGDSEAAESKQGAARKDESREKERIYGDGVSLREKK